MKRAVVVLAVVAAVLAGCSQSPSTTPTSTGTSPTGSTTGTPTTATQEPQPAPPVPHVTFEAQESQNQLLVACCPDATADWDRIGVRIDSMGVESPIFMGQSSDSGYQNERATPKGAKLELGSVVAVTSKATRMHYGDKDADYLEFCADAQAQELRISIVDLPSETVLGTYRFQFVHTCPTIYG